MLNITPFSTACVKVDQYADYIPFVSSVTNMLDLFLNHVFRPCAGEARLENNHYFAYLNTKTLLRSIILIVPVIGNVFIGIIDVYMAIKAERVERLAGYLNRPSEAGSAFQLYEAAAQYGSVEAMYECGVRLVNGTGLKQKLPDLGKKHLRAAAALGHPRAQTALQHYFPLATA